MRNVLLASVATVALLAGGPVLAQQSSSAPTPNTQAQGGSSGSALQQQSGTYRSHSEADDFEGEIAGDHEADDLTDKTVVNDDGDEIGTITDLAIGEEDRVEHVVIELSDSFKERSQEGGMTGTTGSVAQAPTTGTTGQAGTSAMGLGQGEQDYVLVEIDALQAGEGDADEDQFVLDKSQSEISQMTGYTKQEDRWVPSS